MSRAAFTDASLLRLVAVDDPHLSPDGLYVAWTRTSFVPEDDATVRHVVVSSTRDAAAERCLGSGMQCFGWTPDGRHLTCTVTSSSGTDVVLVDPFATGAAHDGPGDAPGGEAGNTVCVVRGLDPVGDLCWSPCGTRLAVIVRRWHGDGAPDALPVGVVRTTRLRWKRDGVGAIGDRFDHLGVVHVDVDGGTPATPTWWVDGPVDVAGPAWSPDGRRLAFVGSLDDPSWESHRRAAVYVVDVADVADVVPTPRCVARFADVRGSGVAWSPLGDELAVVGHKREGFGHYAAQRLWLVDVASGACRAITTDADGTVGNAAYTDTGGSGQGGPVWEADASGVWTVLSVRGSVVLARVGRDGTVAALTPDDRVVAGFAVSGDRSTIVVVAHPRDASPDLATLDAGTPEGLRNVTHLGRDFVSGHAVVVPRHLRVDDGRGPPLDAWMLVPPASDDARIPVVLYTGGGPAGMRSDNFHLEWQVFAARGYAVVWTNARGCQGYGDDFGCSILGAWGGHDHDDQMRALDAALSAEPRLDRSRQAIAGGSYGGYAVAWAIAHEDRFRAAIADRAVVDKLAAFGMSDIGPQRAFEFGGALPWEDPRAYLAQSPIHVVDRVRTPTLIVHSAQDHRCTVGQGEALYAALRARGVPTRLVRFPNESHGLSRSGRPWHRVRRIREYVEWLDRYVGPGVADGSVQR